MLSKLQQNMYKVILFTIYLISHINCEDSLRDSLVPCRLKDTECQRGTFNYLIKDAVANGRPDVGVPPLDPFHIENFHVSYLGMLDVTLIKGVVYGINNCNFTKYNINMDKGRAQLEAMCDLNIKGHYKFETNGPLILLMYAGLAPHGDGNVDLTIEQMHLVFNCKVSLYKGSDNENHLKFDKTYDFEILKRLHIDADNIFIGKLDVTKQANQIINASWRYMKELIRPFVNKAMNYYVLYSNNIFETIPARYFIVPEDLEPYVKK